MLGLRAELRVNTQNVQFAHTGETEASWGLFRKGLCLPTQCWMQKPGMGEDAGVDTG